MGILEFLFWYSVVYPIVLGIGLVVVPVLGIGFFVGLDYCWRAARWLTQDFF